MKKIYFGLIAILLSVSALAQSDSLHYRIVIKFGSVAAGVPDNKPVLDYISSFKKKNKVKKIAYDHIGPMGREGEYHMAFSLKELTKKQKALFVKDIKSIAAEKLTDRGYAHIEENTAIAPQDYGKKIIHKVL